VNILVTGATGFIGRHLLDHLETVTGAVVYGLSRSSAPGRHTTCELSEAAGVGAMLKQINPSLVFHLAGSFSNDFDTDYRNNVLAAKNLLDAVAEQALPTRVLLMGSAAEYGIIRPVDNPVKETQALKPVSIYGWTKAAQTQLASLYASTHGVDVTVARTFNLTGAGMSEQLFVGRVQKQITALLAGEQDRIHVGRLDAERDYLDVTTACKHLHVIAVRGAAGEVYNVGSGRPTGMRALLQDMLHTAGLDMTVVDEAGAGKATPHAQVDCIYADVTRVHALLDHRNNAALP
jgi:GDP-4-dehydro-6-deoxy-D-mannose reductase